MAFAAGIVFWKKSHNMKMQGLLNLSPQHLGSRSTCKSAHAEEWQKLLAIVQHILT
jgi:hypothetical protein